MTVGVLVRRSTSDQGTFGLLTVAGQSWFTGELPWRENASNISCIPPGTYECTMTLSPAFRRKLYLVEGVSDRLGIRIHPANLMGDKAAGYRCQLNGCIALGKRLGTMDGQQAVLLSAPAVTELEHALEGKPFTLEIRG